MTGPAFGLYTANGFGGANRLSAGASLALDRPVSRDGATVFRRSLWLPLPPRPSGLQALRLAAGSALAVRFTPIRLTVGTGDRDWFPSVRDLGDRETRIEFAWPAEVVRIGHQGGVAGRREATLHRADGDAVSEEPTLSGVTGSDLDEPWVGSPLVVRLGEPVFVVVAEDAGLVQQVGAVPVGPFGARAAAPRAAPAAAPDTDAQARAAGGGAVGSGPSIEQRPAGLTELLGSLVVPTLTLAGRPTTPRLKLVAEQGSGETLLWQALLAGEQPSTTLPTGAIDAEWAAACEQIVKLDADPDPQRHVQRLRLDLESDAPCNVHIDALQLALAAEIELLGAAQPFAFDGVQVAAQPVPLALPAGIGLGDASLRLTGRVSADAAAGAGAAVSGPDARHGAHLDPTRVLLVPIDLATPLVLAGATLLWQPTSVALRARLRLLPDGGNGPAARALTQAELDLEDVAAGWLALRWPPLVLQPQTLYLEWTVAAGSGLLAFATGGRAGGWLAAPGSPAARQPLPEPLAVALLESPPEPALAGAANTRPFALAIGSFTLADALPAGAFEQVVVAPTLSLLASQPLLVSGGARGSVTLESARLNARL